MNSLQERVAGFLARPPPSTLIIVGESATRDILITFARSGTLKTNQDELLLDACIASNAAAAEEAETVEEKNHFATTSCLLAEIKAEISVG